MKKIIGFIICILFHSGRHSNWFDDDANCYWGCLECGRTWKG